MEGSDHLGYKHVDREYADQFLNGTSIKISLLSAYRQLEGERGDALEGSSVNLIGQVDIGDGDSNVFHLTSGKAWNQYRREEISRWTGLRLENVRNINISNYTSFRSHKDCYIFSCSTKIDQKLRENCRVFKIPSLQNLANLICEKSKISLKTLAISPVNYREVVNDIFKGSPINPNAFIKRSNFSWEKELRICWDTQENRPPKDLFLDLSDKWIGMVEEV